MSALLDDPMVQAGVAPFLAALLAAVLLARLRPASLPWLALAAALATTVALSTGLTFSPLTASRKALLLALAAPLAGWALDLAGLRQRVLPPVLAALCGAAVFWVFQTVLAQAEGAALLQMGGGVALFVALLVALVLRLRGDGVATGAATVGLGLAVGASALLSASIGTLMNGLALAMAGAALLLLQLAGGRPLVPGYAGALGAGVAAAMFAAGTFMLAEGRWFTLALLPLVPLVAALPLVPERSPRIRLVVRGLAAAGAALVPIAAAWLATRAGAPG